MTCQWDLITVSKTYQITGRQIAAGLAIARMTQADLAKAANVSVPTLGRMIASEGLASGMANNIAAVRAALESAGVEFIAENGGGAGVRLRKPPLALAEIDQKIEVLETQAAVLDVVGEPSPERALNQMKKALVENEKVKLVNKRARLAKKTSE